MSDPQRSPEKPVDEWVTGDEPMTGPQQSYLETLAREAGQEVPGDLTKAQASEMIDRLQGAPATGRRRRARTPSRRPPRTAALPARRTDGPRRELRHDAPSTERDRSRDARHASSRRPRPMMNRQPRP